MEKQFTDLSNGKKNVWISWRQISVSHKTKILKKLDPVVLYSGQQVLFLWISSDENMLPGALTPPLHQPNPLSYYFLLCKVQLPSKFMPTASPFFFLLLQICIYLLAFLSPHSQRAFVKLKNNWIFDLTSEKCHWNTEDANVFSFRL